MLGAMKRFRLPQKDPRKTLVLVVIAATLMVLVDRYVWEWSKPAVPSAKTGAVEHLYPEAGSPAGSEVKDFRSAQSILGRMEGSESLADQVFLYMPQPEPILNAAPGAEEPLAQPEPEKSHVNIERPPVSSAAPAIDRDGRPGKVVIIIDDLGMDRKHSREVLDIGAPLTLAFLPYAPGLEEITQQARANGHELIIHTPMEPINGDLNPGPMVLLDSMSDDEIHVMLEKVFASFDGYVGINNHMGSKVTQNRHIMGLVMEELKQRNLFFVDSKTINTSVAADLAARHGLAYAERDVFLDHHDNINFVESSLRQLESIAHRKGYAIAIGHPKEATIAALKAWLPTLKEKNLELVPVSAVVQKDTPAVKAVSTLPPRVTLTQPPE
jgi:polysaccharide deacetylase 2 family uncharacterized protein YibQ